MQNLVSIDVFKAIKIVTPPINEQDLIVKRINELVSEINGQIERIQKEIELLQEYRTALISEVVTGKIDVRQEVVS